MDDAPVPVRAAWLLVASLLAAAPLAAQSPGRAPVPPSTSPSSPAAGIPVLPSSPPAGIIFMEEQLRSLPGRGSIWSLLETAHPFVIVDRIGGAGVFLGEPELFGSHGSSWTQAGFRMDGLDFTDPERVGTPLMHPDPGVFAAIRLNESFPPVDLGGAGATLQLAPRPPSSVTRGSLDVFYVPSQLQAEAPGAVPPIARFASAGQGSLLLGGPLGRRLGLLGSARLGSSRRFERGDRTALDSRLASLFVHGTGTLSLSDRLRFIAGGDEARYPYPARARFPDYGVRGRDAYRHGHLVWEHAPSGGILATAAIGYQRAQVQGPPTHGLAPAGVIERLLDGPVPELVVPPTGPRGRWTASATLQPVSAGLDGRHDVRVGFSISRSFSEPEAQPGALVGELVDGVPARLWEYQAAGSMSRASTDAAAWVQDSLRLLSRLSVDLGARVEWTEASARGTESSIRWQTFLPRGVLRWNITGGGGLSMFAGYGYSRYRLPLGYLAYGDPAAPAARVYRWTDPNGDGLVQATEAGALVATAGPGNRPFFASRIDAGLRAPKAREFMFGFDSRFGRRWAFRITGSERRDYRLIAPVNESVTLDDYVLRHIEDRGNDFLNPVDDRDLPVYDRRPESFGQDSAVLTNPPGHDSHYIGVDVALERLFDGRWHMLFGAAAHRSDGTAANRGFHANENDPGLLGEAFMNPNALTYTRGRLFLERGYVIKWSGGLVAGRGFRLGAIARYQDGQHFSRKVIVHDLAQGPEAVQAYTRGHSRFTYTFTLDARVEQGFSVGAGRLAFILDAFNLLNTRNEVEEDPVVTRAFRASTVLQPPRSLRLGVRWDF